MMKSKDLLSRSVVVVIVAVWGCNSTSKGGGVGGSTTSLGNTGGTGASASDTGMGGAGSGGRVSTGGSASGGAGGGTRVGSGGAGTGGTMAASSGPDAALNGGAGGGCSMGTWPTADPSKVGPFATTTENNVGPQAGITLDSGVSPQFTLYRPKDLTQGGLCFPVITWGNGHGCTPSYCYSALLTRLASHGFVVIASDSPTVSQGSPAPMLAGVTWVLQQNADPASELYQRIDTTHIGAAGHSEGAFATTSVASDSHIVTIAPLCGASAQKSGSPDVFVGS